jgi:hypothetical protein
MSGSTPKQPRLHLGAIGLGLIVDLVGTAASLAAVLVGVSIVSAVRGEPMRSEDAGLWLTEPWLLIGGLVVGLAWNGFGAYIGAMVARREPMRHAAWVGILSLLVGVAITLVPGEGPSEPLWYDVLSFILILPVSLVGGRLAAMSLS